MIQYPGTLSVLLVVLFISLSPAKSRAQGTHVISGAETVIFTEHSLDPDPSVAWSTDRSSTPGYFSAVADATYTGATDASSLLVDGYVKYYRSSSAAANSFTFPVGQGTDYRRVIIGGTIPANSTFATAWFAGDPNTTIDPTDGSTHDRNSRGPGVHAVLAHGFWDWQTLAGTAPNMTITVSIPDVSSSAYAFNLILVGWNGTQWVSLSGMDAGPHGGNWANGNTEDALLSGNWQDGITALGIGTINAVLHTALLSFAGSTNGCKAELNWNIAETETIDDIKIQSTVDGFHWKNVTAVKAAGAANVYRYTVAQNDQTVRYRLAMTDKDGVVTYSPIITLTGNCGQSEYLNVFPNPLHNDAGQVNIQMFIRQKGRANVLVRNISGQTLLNEPITLTGGLSTVSLQTHVLQHGTYMLSVVDENGRTLFPVQKIIKR